MTKFIGFSGYPTSTTELDKIIAELEARGADCYRMSANPTWATGPHPYHPEFVQYLLDHWNGNIIVDRNHIYPPTETGASNLRSHIAEAKQALLEVCQQFPNNPRVLVELFNEYVSTDFGTIAQELIDTIRGAGYTNPIVVDKWETSWSSYPHDNISPSKLYGGMHFYFNAWSVSGAMTQMSYAIAHVNSGKLAGIINTEIGADYSEYLAFSVSEVEEVNEFLDGCDALGIGNCVWMNENLNNLATYENMNLVMPEADIPTTPPPTLSIDIIESEHGTTTPIAGHYEGTGSMTITAIPDEGYLLDQWVVDGFMYDDALTITVAYVEGGTEVTPIFEQIVIPPTERYINILASEHGTTIPSAGHYMTTEEGISMSIQAIPDEGYRLSHWLFNGEIVTSEANEVNVLYQETGVEIQAVFVMIDPPMTNPDVSLTIKCPSCGEPVFVIPRVTITENS